MNQIEIKYSFFSKKPELYINGEIASPYSTLMTIASRPFLESAEQLISELDNEIFDDYEIDVYATAFHYEILKKQACKSDYCSHVEFHNIELLSAPTYLVNSLKKLANRYNISIHAEKSLNVFLPTTSHITPLFSGAKLVDSVNADIGVFHTSEAVPPTINTVVIIHNEFDVKVDHGRSIVFVPEEKLRLFWEFCEFEYVTVPAVTEYTTALRYIKLSEKDKTEFNAIKENIPAYYLGEIPDVVDSGECFHAEFESYPPHSFSLLSCNPEIIRFSESEFNAISPGTATVIVVDSSGKTVEARPVCVIKHQYAEEIRLVPRFEYLKKNEKNRIDVIVTPSNAEDANTLVWSNSHPRIAQVDESGNIIALEYGKTTVMVEGHRVRSQITIEVKPALQSLQFSQPSLVLKNGESIVIECNASPSNAPTDSLTWEIDNRVIASINISKDCRKCQVIASTGYEGKGNIRCYDSDSKLCAICNLEVVSTKKQTTIGKIGLACFLIGILWPFLLPISIGAGAYGLYSDSEEDHRGRYWLCIVGSGIALLIWLLFSLG